MTIHDLHRLPRRWVMPGLVVLVLAAGAPRLAADDDDDGPGAGIPVPAEPRTVVLPRDQQDRVDLAVATGEASSVSPEFSAFATVVDLQPLLALRAQHNTTRSERDIAAASLQKTRRELERLRTLHDEAGKVSTRQVQDARAAHAMDVARVRAAERQLEDNLLRAQQSWGPVLARAALEQDTGLFQSLAALEEVLLLVTLPPDRALPGGVETIAVSRSGDRGAASTARLVSAAPIAGTTAQGETYFFRAAGAGLRTGMRVQAWIPSGGQALNVVRVPASAVIWHEGKPWIYARRDSETFTRAAITAYRTQGEDWLIEAPALAGRDLVIVGGQTLLAEEYRWRIPDEDDDP